MRAILLAACLSLSAAPAALAQSISDTSNRPNATPVMAAGYMSEAGQSDVYEVTSSRLALTRARMPEVRTFAQQMIDEHTKTTQMIMEAARRGGLTPPPAPPAPDQVRASLLDALTQVGAEDAKVFERRYLAQQMQAHREALALHHNYAQKGDNAALRQVAGQIVPHIQHHIAMLEKIKP